MKRVVLLLFVLPVFAMAQQKYTAKKEWGIPFTEAKDAISLNPFAIAQIDYTALLGYEHKLREKLFLSTEAGYIFASGYIGSTDGDNNVGGSGFLIRPSVKWFVSNNTFYLQPQVFYKQVTHRLYDWLGKEAVNGVSSYEELQDFKYRRKIKGFNLVSGFVLPLSQHRDAYIDIYFGLGVRYKKSVIVGEPNSIYPRPATVFMNSDSMDDGVFSSLPAGIRFIYVFH